MSTNVQVTESLKPVLSALEFGFNSGVICEEIGREVVKLIQDNFRTLPPNERGFPSTGFWQRAAEATQYEVVPDGVLISVNQVGVRQRFFGGRIKPVLAEYLTIPAVAETYGCSATDFGNLKVIRGSFKTYWGSFAGLALVPADWDEKEVDRFGVYFWLVSAVTQEENPDVLPADDDIFDASSDAVNHYLNNLTKGQDHK
jgi:hypothetical protein